MARFSAELFLLFGAPGRNADRDRAGADLDEQLLAGRACAAVQLVPGSSPANVKDHVLAGVQRL
jgi:hypothetical protein